MKRFTSFTRHSFGVRNRGPWRSILSHTLHQFHENDLFTSAAAMSYFGLMALFPALLVLLAIGNRIAAATELLTHAVDVYPGSGKFLRETIRAMSSVGTGVIVTCVIVTLWATPVVPTIWLPKLSEEGEMVTNEAVDFTR